MVTLTEQAITAVGRFIAGSEILSAGLRMEVTDGVCSGYQYGLKLKAINTPEDTVIDCDHVKVFIDPGNLPILDGMSRAEHPAILSLCDYLEKEGYTIHRMPVDKAGRLILNSHTGSKPDSQCKMLLMLIFENVRSTTKFYK